MEKKKLRHLRIYSIFQSTEVQTYPCLSSCYLRLIPSFCSSGKLSTQALIKQEN